MGRSGAKSAAPAVPTWGAVIDSPSAPAEPPPSGWTTQRSGRWRITTSSGSAAALHRRPIPTDPEHDVWIHHVDGPALVLGSTQPDDVIDGVRAAADRVEVCRRRSGGGVVGLTPETSCWIDVIVPAGSDLWHDDIGLAFDWLGRTWVRALISAIPPLAVDADIKVHRGPLEGGAAGRLVCFASLGPGEVTVEGRKVVGISQRRTRTATRFQCVAIGRWQPHLLLQYMNPDLLRRAEIDLVAMAAGLDRWHWPGPHEVAAAFCASLPDTGPATPGSKNISPRPGRY